MNTLDLIRILAAAGFAVLAVARFVRRDDPSIARDADVALPAAMLAEGAWLAAQFASVHEVVSPPVVALVDLLRAAAWAVVAWLLARRLALLSEPRAQHALGVVAAGALLWSAGAVGDTLVAQIAGRALLAVFALLLLVLASLEMRARQLGAPPIAVVALAVVLAADLARAAIDLGGQAVAATEIARTLLGTGLLVILATSPARVFDVPGASAFASPTDHRLTRFLAALLLVACGLGLLLVARDARLPEEILVGAAFGAAAVAGIVILSAPRILTVDERPDRPGRTEGERYDYREEWLQFIDRLGREGQVDNEPLPARIVDVVAQIVAAEGGALWLVDETRVRLAAHRELVLDIDPPLDPNALGLILATARDSVIELDRSRAPGRIADLVEGWRAVRGAWLLLPLVHRRRLVGIILLARPHRRRRLDWEDRKLLRLLGRAAASYLVEDIVSRALQEARELEGFNRRFAFVAHDLKHVAARLDLVLANARRFRQNPDFYEDLLETLEDTAIRADRLVRELRGETRPPVGTDLALLIEGVVASRSGPRPHLEEPIPHLRIQADAARLASALDHLIDNGFEACGDGGTVTVSVRQEARMAVVEVHDNGTGIAPDYIERSFGKPFVSTKPGGMGLGLFEVRHTVEAMGGRLEAETAAGSGTIMRLLLPRLIEAAR